VRIICDVYNLVLKVHASLPIGRSAKRKIAKTPKYEDCFSGLIAFPLHPCLPAGRLCVKCIFKIIDLSSAALGVFH